MTHPPDTITNGAEIEFEISFQAINDTKIFLQRTSQTILHAARTLYNVRL